MEVALDALRKTGQYIDDTDIQRLSPLGHDHINIMGRYSFSLPAEIENGGLRPLVTGQSGINEIVNGI